MIRFLYYFFTKKSQLHDAKADIYLLKKVSMSKFTVAYSSLHTNTPFYSLEKIKES